MKYFEKLSKKKLGEILISEGVITKEQLDTALTEQQSKGGKLGEVLITMNLATEMDIAKAIAKRFQLPFIFPSKYSITEDVRKILSNGFLRKHQIIPLDLFGNILVIASYVVPKINVIEQIRNETGFELFFYIATQTDIEVVLEKMFPEEAADANWENIFDSANEEVIKDLKQ